MLTHTATGLQKGGGDLIVAVCKEHGCADPWISRWISRLSLVLVLLESGCRRIVGSNLNHAYHGKSI